MLIENIYADPGTGDAELTQGYWQGVLDDVAYYRDQAAKGRIPFNPEWDEWEAEALGALDEEAEDEVRHLPGKHDQKTHAGGRGRNEYGLLHAEAGGTQEKHSTVSGGRRTYNADRVADVHDPFIASLTEGKPTVAEPELVFMGGGSGAGKGTLIRSGKSAVTDDHVISDSDAAKAALPEYQERVKAGDSTAAAYAHEESSDLAKRAVRESLEAGHNTVLDGTGNNSVESIKGKVDAARAAGAKRVVAEYVTIPTEMAVQRATERAARSGREVPLSTINYTHTNVSRAVPKVIEAGLFDSVRVWDNSNGPRLIAEAKNGRDLTIYDDVAYSAFLAKGNGEIRSDGVGAGGGVVPARVADFLRGVDDPPASLDGLDLFDETLEGRSMGGTLPGGDGLVDRYAERRLRRHLDDVIGRDGGHSGEPTA